MHAKTKPSTILPNNNLSSPTFLTQNSTDIATPSLITSPFSAGQGERFLSPIIPATPDRKLAKPDIIYISKSELEKELHIFVNTLIEQKAVNQNEITHHLEHLKKQVVNLNNENSRLLASPNTTHIEGDSHPNSSRDHRIEELEAQKQSSDDRIRDHSLYIQRLEKKVNDLVNQCQGLMRINHEMSSQILQMSQLPPSGDSQLEKLIEENQELSEENNRLREIVVKLESARNASNDSRNTMDHLRVDTDMARKPEIRRDQLKSISFRGDSPPDSAVTDKQKSEVENLKETIESLSAQLHNSQAENKRLRDELERPTIGDVDVSIHMPQGNKSLREVVKEPLEMPSTLDVGHRTSRTETKATSPELLKKQLGDYKSANVILQKKAEKYLLQIEDLNGALKQANENLDALQNKYITLEKELVNKNKLESILNVHINLMKKLEVKIHTLTEENILLQQANEENLVVITELKSQLEEAAPRIHDAESGTKFTTPPRSGRRYSGDARASYLSPCRSPDTIALEREIINKKYDEKVKKVHHEHDMTIRAERIKHKNQIEKYNMNLDVLSRKIQALVAVNEDLGKEFEMLKVEFTNYRTLSWSVLQEIQKYLENCKRYDEVIEKSILDITVGNNTDLKAQDLRTAYDRLKSDILNINDVIEDRKRYM